MDEVTERIGAKLLAGESVTVVGRPGTGKTTMLESVYAQLMSSVSPSSVLVLTPNRDHADVLRNRLAVPRDAVLASAPARSISSFAYGIARAAHTTQTGDDLEFISGADQDVFLADLLAGHELGHGRGPAWPAEITAEVRSTSAFRTEVRDFLNRVMEFDFGVRIPAPSAGGGPEQTPEFVFDFGRSALDRVLEHHRDPRWEAVAQVLEEYLDIMSMPGYGGTDSATVLARAAFEILREPAEVTAGRAWTFAPDVVPTVVLADGVQDFPAASWGLLEQLRERGSALALFGSPETVTGRFHGADASIIDRSASDERFTTVVLPEVKNTADELVAVGDDFGRRITTRWGLQHMPRPDGAARTGESADGIEPVDAGPQQGEGEPEPVASSPDKVETHVFEGAASSYRYLARRVTNFVEDGHAWSDVAVLCRNTSTARVVANELSASGVATANIMQPLSIDPATAPLLELLARTPDFDDDESIAAQALSLAGSIYVRLDPVQIRRFKRVVRKQFPAAKSSNSLAQALRSDIDDSSPPGLATISRMLHAAAEVGSVDPHEALWGIWEAAGIADKWQTEVLKDPESVANAHLDSVLRLFTLAEKISDRGGFTARSFAGIVAEQDIAQDSLAAQAGTDDLVQVGTPSSLAHLRVPLVIIAEVNEGVWPNPKIRGGILGLDDLSAVLLTGETVTSDPGYHSHAKRTNLREEGELFYTALTRAEEHVIVTAISDAESNPSPFFDVLAAGTAKGTQDADGYAITHEDELLPLSLAEMAAHARARLLRAAADSEQETAAEDVEEWAQLMAALSATSSTVDPPERWRETEDITSAQPLYGAEDLVKVSPSQVESFTDCSLRWFLTRNGGDRPGSLAQSLGTIIHAAAENYPQGPASAIREFVDEEFKTLDFDAEWERDREHVLAMKMADRLGEYIKDSPGEPIGVEAQVYATGVDENGQEWKVTGRLDRIERTPEGIRIVDFKTGKNTPTGQEMPRHAQLGVYQEAINSGSITIGDDQVVDAKAYGAELVFLRYTKQKKREQSALEIDEDPGWARDLINDVSGRMRAAEFPARVEPQKCMSCPVRTSCPAIGPKMLEDS
ncbi:MAG: PD-(D/E)XK nuclease family protein [Brevibacterium aurantiacum]|uniref:DNA helicase UvrD n=2 Tax=Brevibacterium aurantiacum TaxID=273384 RepID=A0A2A3YY22_BREAU|nr:PD-(D/E)XK nuclease family protein [Brevibacterium aurantiacum]MDN5549246.1 PD-(D/E)XK nuclease family protein [Brevibacterium sp.]AZT93300.1 PD-(D/E)XK nuclease family protein [Brevibacterium aurantiacum]MDN5593360.1 PD-(D/E)XK nuclease family protein [Brevibacterium sp.]MDN5607377.1 PD-(D/E)XK nuclease family protein [Brevibacterium sp.]MDN5711573.1 PD-(D/E)XK nuclease family protein [Brevibacterium aurantiacum]